MDTKTVETGSDLTLSERMNQHEFLSTYCYRVFDCLAPRFFFVAWFDLAQRKKDPKGTPESPMECLVEHPFAHAAGCLDRRGLSGRIFTQLVPISLVVHRPVPFLVLEIYARIRKGTGLKKEFLICGLVIFYFRAWHFQKPKRSLRI